MNQAFGHFNDAAREYVTADPLAYRIDLAHGRSNSVPEADSAKDPPS